MAPTGRAACPCDGPPGPGSSTASARRSAGPSKGLDEGPALRPPAAVGLALVRRPLRGRRPGVACGGPEGLGVKTAPMPEGQDLGVRHLSESHGVLPPAPPTGPGPVLAYEAGAWGLGAAVLGSAEGLGPGRTARCDA